MPRHPNKLKLTAAVLSGAFLVAGISACGRTQSTESLLSDAKQYEQKGDRKAAQIQLKNAVEKSPDNGEVRVALANIDLAMGDAVSAEKEYRKALALGIAADRVLPGLGKSLVQQSKIKDVLTVVTPEAAAKSPELLVLRGNSLMATGKTEEGKAAFGQALALNPNNGDALIGMAQYSMITKDTEGADRYMQESIAKDPKNPEVFMYRGTMLRMQGKGDEALTAFSQAQTLDPHNRNVHIEKAYVLITQRKFADAKTEIDAAEKMSPGNLLVTYTRALLEFSKGHFGPANDGLQKVLKVAPDHLPSVLLAGASEMNLGLIEQADRHLRKYLESNPNDAYARKLLAQTQLKSAQPADAVATLAPVMTDANSKDPQLLALAGESAMQTRDFAKASTYFEKAVALAPKAAPLHTSLGMARLALGDQTRGLSELELASSLDPKSSQATMALVQTELNLKHNDKALAAVLAQEKQQPDNVQIQNLKGAVYMVMNDHANARIAFAKAATLQPTFMPAATNLARLDLIDKKPDAAKARFMTVLAADKNNVGAMTALGDLALVAGKPDDATPWFEKANAVNPDALAPALRLGRHYIQNKQPEKALNLARKYQPANPTNPELLEMIGQAQVATKDNSGALETYSKLTNVLPKSAPAQLRLAGVHLLMKNDSAAAADLKRAIDLQPDYYPARVTQIEMALRANRPQDAIDIARQVQKSNANVPVGYVMEGDIQMTQKKPDLALAPYEKALALSKSPEAMVKVVQALQASGKTKDVQARASAWLAAHPGDLRMGMFVAEGDLAAKDYKGAIVVLESMLKTNPNEPATLNNLAWAYQQTKDPRALATAEQAYKLAGDNPAVLDTLGWMLLEQGNTARAVPLLQKASGLAPQSTEMRYHLAVGLQKAGDKPGARKELNTLLSANTPFPQQEQARALLNTL